MKISGVIFDNDGNSYTIDNVDVYIGIMKDRLLVKTYASTIFFHEAILKMEELVKKGLAKQTNVDEDYNAELTMNSINSMRDEIVERFDKDYHDYVISKIDLSIKDKNSKK